MALDGIAISCITRELSDRLTDSHISKIAQTEKDELMVTFKGANRTQYRVLMSASASLPLIYIADKNKQAPATAPNFCMLLRKHIGSGRIVSVTQPGLERIIRFEIEHRDELGDLRRKNLILELMGKYSNIIFCDEENTIIDSIKRISAQTSSVREVLPGRTYFIPETQNKLDPLHTSEEEFIASVFVKPMPLSKAIYNTYTGISPVIAEEVCHRAGLESDQSAVSIEELQRIHLAHQFMLLCEDIAQGNFSPNIIFDKEGNPVEFAALSLSMYSDMEHKDYETISQVLQDYYSMKEVVTRIRQKSADLRRIVSTAIDRTRKKQDLQLRQLRDTDKRDKYRVYGELLHTYGYEAQSGDKTLTCINYYTGEEVTIPLDETKTAAENAKRFFEKYDKMKRTYEALTTLTEETGADLEHLISIQTFLDLALSEEELVQVKEELTDEGYIHRKFTQTKGKKVKITSRPYHYRNADGYDIYVGKNNYQNDELTFKFASGGDWWFHCKGAPGSHVVLKSQGTEIPDRAFEDAARLAAFYSANRQAGKVEIDYVQRKEVKKPGGGKPGFVVYYTNYSMVIDTDISGLTLVE